MSSKEVLPSLTLIIYLVPLTNSYQNDAILLPVLPSIKEIKLGRCDPPTPSFINELLSTAPNLAYIILGGNDGSPGHVTSAGRSPRHSETLNRFRAKFSYPGQEGTYKTGRGRNVRENSMRMWESKNSRKRGVWVDVARDVVYKAEEA
ncbi:hypothetical protein H0H87_006861 [Tephrocybe sp. NHM501043]|nr:hypothetical protein H0H87_006861 [Tephrocybe sp. NHM501043]